MTYKIGPVGNITRDVDGASIPADPANVDYAAYLAWVSAGNTAQVVVRSLSPDDVDRERDRRLGAFVFGGVEYDFDTASRALIGKARGSALPAILAGAQVGDYRWADIDNDFGWIDKANEYNLMDAHTCLAFGNAAASWEGRHIIAGRVIKNMTPIPANYASNDWWP